MNNLFTLTWRRIFLTCNTLHTSARQLAEAADRDWVPCSKSAREWRRPTAPTRDRPRARC